MSLPVQQARGIFTKAFIRYYEELIKVPSFLSSFFPEKTYETKTVAIEVQRGTERIAVDVQRGTRGNRNTFSKSTEKEWLPPMYDEYTDATNLSGYDRMYGSDIKEVSEGQITSLTKGMGMKLAELTNKIKRAKELMCSNIFNTGVITLENGDVIDFKRKAASMVDVSAGAGEFWSVAASQIEDDLIAAVEFIRQKGKNGAGEFNLILSGLGWRSVKTSNFFTNAANFRQAQLIDINMPQKEAFGPGFHGQISAGAYKFNIWTYDETYEDSTGTTQRYWPSNKAVVIPVNGTDFEMSHAAIPAVVADPNNAETPEYIKNLEGKYIHYNFIDRERTSHTFGVKCAPLAVPITIDQIYTMQILA